MVILDAEIEQTKLNASINHYDGLSVVDCFVKISDTDQSEDYLNDKLVVGSGLSKSILNPGSYETLQISLADSENLWDRSGTTLIPHNEGDNIYLSGAGKTILNIDRTAGGGTSALGALNINDNSTSNDYSFFINRQSGAALVGLLAGSGCVGIPLGIYIRNPSNFSAGLHICNGGTGDCYSSANDNGSIPKAVLKHTGNAINGINFLNAGFSEADILLTQASKIKDTINGLEIYPKYKGLNIIGNQITTGSIAGSGLVVNGNINLTGSIQIPIQPNGVYDGTNKSYVDSGLNLISGLVYNDNSNLTNLSGNVYNLSGNVYTNTTDITNLSGVVYNVSGALNTLSGVVYSISGTGGESLWTSSGGLIYPTSGETISGNLISNFINSTTFSGTDLNINQATVSTLLDANEIHANTILTNSFRANTIYGNSLTLQSDTGGDIPTATPLYFKTLNNQAAKINIPNGYGQTYWEFPDDSRFVGNYMIFGPPDEMSYFIPEFVDGYTYMAYGPSGMQWYSHGEETLVLDAYSDGTTEWHEDGKYDKNLTITGSLTTSTILPDSILNVNGYISTAQGITAQGTITGSANAFFVGDISGASLNIVNNINAGSNLFVSGNINSGRNLNFINTLSGATAQFSELRITTESGEKTEILFTGTENADIYHEGTNSQIGIYSNAGAVYIGNSYGATNQIMVSGGKLYGQQGIKASDMRCEGALILNNNNGYISSEDETSYFQMMGADYYSSMTIGPSGMHYFTNNDAEEFTTIDKDGYWHFLKTPICNYLEVESGTALLFGETETQNAWRIRRLSNDLLFQFYSGTAWATKFVISGA